MGFTTSASAAYKIVLRLTKRKMSAVKWVGFAAASASRRNILRKLQALLSNQIRKTDMLILNSKQREVFISEFTAVLRNFDEVFRKLIKKMELFKEVE